MKFFDYYKSSDRCPLHNIEHCPTCPKIGDTCDVDGCTAPATRIVTITCDGEVALQNRPACGPCADYLVERNGESLPSFVSVLPPR